MAYRRVNWQESVTPLSAENMNNIENGIEEALAGLKPVNIKTTVLDLFYPVGSYYETSDRTFNPSVSWGGTWELEESGRFHVAAGTGYVIGSTGGEATVTLTPEEMPSHTHVQNSHNHTQNAHKHTQASHNHVYGDGNPYGVYINGTLSNEEGGALSGSGRNYPYITKRYSTSKFGAGNMNSDAPDIRNTTATNQATTATNQNTGGGQAHNNIPPYVAVNRWHRTA